MRLPNCCSPRARVPWPRSARPYGSGGCSSESLILESQRLFVATGSRPPSPVLATLQTLLLSGYSRLTDLAPLHRPRQLAKAPPQWLPSSSPISPPLAGPRQPCKRLHLIGCVGLTDLAPPRRPRQLAKAWTSAAASGSRISPPLASLPQLYRCSPSTAAPASRDLGPLASLAGLLVLNPQ